MLQPWLSAPCRCRACSRSRRRAARRDCAALAPTGCPCSSSCQQRERRPQLSDATNGARAKFAVRDVTARLGTRGVPVLLIMALGGGVDLVNGGREAGDRWVSEFTAKCYHQTCDEWHEEWDLRGAAQDVDLLYIIGKELAFGERWPVCLPESEFKALRPDLSSK